MPRAFRPVGIRDLRRGDRLLLQNTDNTRYVAEVSRTESGSAFGRRVGPDGLAAGRVEAIRSWQILGREGGPIFKHVGNMIPGDFVYSPGHRSGFQYGKIIALPNGAHRIIRWKEAAGEWTKPQEIDGPLDFIGHESEPGSFERFFARMAEDRADWLHNPGRSGWRTDPETGEQRWRDESRRWPR